MHRYRFSHARPSIPRWNQLHRPLLPPFQLQINVDLHQNGPTLHPPQDSHPLRQFQTSQTQNKDRF